MLNTKPATQVLIIIISIITRKCVSCSVAIATWGHPVLCQSFSALTEMFVPSMKSVNLSVAHLWCFYCWCLMLPCDLIYLFLTFFCKYIMSCFDPLTLNVCSTLGLMWSKSVLNLIEIEQSVAELLMIYQVCTRGFSSVLTDTLRRVWTKLYTVRLSYSQKGVDQTEPNLESQRTFINAWGHCFRFHISRFILKWELW